jgi:hypothetical protein
MSDQVSLVSASQYELFHNKCKRAWYFRYVTKLPDESKFSQRLGTATHAIIESNMTGKPVDPDATGYVEEEKDTRPIELAQVVAQSLPDRTYEAHYQNEHFFSMPTYPGGPDWVGYIDLIVRPGIGLPAMLIPPDNNVPIIDFKTTSNFRYMKTESELLVSPQMLSYGYWALEHGFPSFDLDGVWLAHIYLNTKAPITRASVRHVRVDATRAYVRQKWSEMLEGVKEMEETAHQLCADDVDPTGMVSGHCNAYGGCAFKKQCGLDAHSILFGRKQKQENLTPMSNPLLDRINAAKAAQAAQAAGQVPQAAPPPAPVQEPQATPVAPPQPKPITEAIAYLKGQTGGKSPHLRGALAALYSTENGLPQGIEHAGTCSAVASTVEELQAFINEPGKLLSQIQAPPQIVLPTAPVTITQVQVNNPNPDRFVEAVAAKAQPFTGVVPPDAPPREQAQITTPTSPAPVSVASAPAGNPSVPPTVQAGVPMPVAQEPPKRRGRPPGSKNKATQAQPVLSAPKTETETGTDGSSFVLWIDCLPSKGASFELAELWLAPIAQAVAEAQGVSHWAEVQYIAKAALANGIEAVINSGEEIPNLAIDSRVPGSEVLIEKLSPLAAMIVRGLR